MSVSSCETKSTGSLRLRMKSSSHSRDSRSRSFEGSSSRYSSGSSAARTASCNLTLSPPEKLRSGRSEANIAASSPSSAARAWRCLGVSAAKPGERSKSSLAGSESRRAPSSCGR